MNEDTVSVQPTSVSNKNSLSFLLAAFGVTLLVLIGGMIYAINRINTLTEQVNKFSDGSTNPESLVTTIPTNTPFTTPVATGTVQVTPTPTVAQVEEKSENFTWTVQAYDAIWNLSYTLLLPVGSKIKTESASRGIRVNSTVSFPSGTNLMLNYVGDGASLETRKEKKDVLNIGKLKNGEKLYRAVLNGKYTYFTTIFEGECDRVAIPNNEVCAASELTFKAPVNGNVSVLAAVYIDIEPSLLSASELTKFDEAVLSIR